jgi:response regulator RpfG family c-di-GMP phosphodiesterase
MSTSRSSGINQRIADRLLAEGRIKREDHQRAVEYATRQKGRIEEALVELEVMSEADLLKFIATTYSTRFVSTERLAKAVIEARVLQRVPVRTAELHGVFPVLFDDKAGALSIVTADPDNDVALHEVKLTAGVKDVRALAARPAAVRAAIAYHYRGDRAAFQALLRPLGMPDLLNNDPYDRRASQPQQQVPPTPHPLAPPWQPHSPPAGPPQAWGQQPGWQQGQPPGWQQQPPGWGQPPMPQAGWGGFQNGPQPPWGPQQGQAPYGVPPEAPQGAQRQRSITPTKIDHVLNAPEAPRPDTPDTTKGSAMGLVQGAGAAPKTPAPSAAPKPGSIPPAAPVIPIAASPPLVEALNVLVSLLETSRADLRGHSSMVARLTRKTCERIGLSPLQTAAFTAAAYLHDLGKMGAYHLTALNVAEYEGHRVAAGKSADLPLHLMESVGLLPETKSAIASMYERYDGSGLPNGEGGKEIPLGARILSVADTYADLTQNPRNPYRKILRPSEACEVLDQYRGTIFDPNIVDIFRQSTTGEDMRAKLLSDRHEALIVDPDPEETTVLELRLIEQGFQVTIARTAPQAKKILAESEIDVVVSEIDLDAPDAGLALLSEVKKESKGRDVTWVVLTGKTDKQVAQRAFDLGVDDFVQKPVSTDIFVAKVRQLIERKSSTAGGGAVRGVSGSLSEMSLPDMVQILWHGRKTCALRISAGPSSGEIDFAEGMVVDARWDAPRDSTTAAVALRGEDAFYKMLTLHDGEFRVDPSYKPSTRSIQASPEALLLEGMRRLDEASV